MFLVHKERKLCILATVRQWTCTQYYFGYVMKSIIMLFCFFKLKIAESQQMLVQMKQQVFHLANECLAFRTSKMGKHNFNSMLANLSDLTLIHFNTGRSELPSFSRAHTAYISLGGRGVMGHSMSNHQIFGHFSTDLLRFFWNLAHL